MKLKNQPLITRFAMYYFIVLVIPMFVVLFVYFDTLGIVEQDTYEAHLSVLKQSSDIVDRDLADLERMVVQLKSSVYVNQFVLQENPLVDPPSISDISALQNNLEPYLTTNNLVDRIIIYSQKADTIVSNQSTVIRLDKFYGKLFRIEGMSYEQWVSNFLNKRYNREFIYNVPITTSGTSGKYLVYANSIPRTGAHNVANIFVLVNQKTFLNLFKSINDLETGWCYISDNKGNVITENNDLDSNTINRINSKIVNKKGYFIQNINGKDMFITYVHGVYNNFRYVSAVSLASVVEKVKNIRLVLGGLITGAFILGVFIVLLLAYRSSEPINKLIKVLVQNDEVVDIRYDYDFLNLEISNIMNKNKMLRKELAAQLPAQTISLFYRLLNGEFKDYDELMSSFSKLGITAEAEFYAVIIISFNDVDAQQSLETFSAYKVILNKVLYQVMPRIMGTYDLDFEKEVIIIPSNHCNYDQFIQEVEMMANKVYDEFQKTTSISVSFSGSITNDIMNIHMAYYEAKTALGYIRSEENMKVLWYKKGIEQSDLLFYYPLDKEIELLDAVVNCDERKCRSLLNELYKINFVRNNLAEHIGIQLLNSMISTLFRATERFPKQQEYLSESLHELMDSLDKKGDVESEFKKIRDFILEFCRSVNNSNRDENTSLIKQITDYIDSNFQDCQISLASVASQFNITEIYLSRFFKDQTGENFSKYVERLRMEKAQELISEQGLPISVVAERVGYNYPQVFRRVYKRYYGKTPSQSNKS